MPATTASATTAGERLELSSHNSILLKVRSVAGEEGPTALERSRPLVCCRHSPLHHYCYWNKWVANPIKNCGYVGKGRLAMRLLKSEILEKILLRRTKVQCADVLALPPRYLPAPPPGAATGDSAAWAIEGLPESGRELRS